MNVLEKMSLCWLNVSTMKLLFFKLFVILFSFSGFVYSDFYWGGFFTPLTVEVTDVYFTDGVQGGTVTEHNNGSGLGLMGGYAFEPLPGHPYFLSVNGYVNTVSNAFKSDDNVTLFMGSRAYGMNFKYGVTLSDGQLSVYGISDLKNLAYDNITPGNAFAFTTPRTEFTAGTGMGISFEEDDLKLYIEYYTSRSFSFNETGISYGDYDSYTRKISYSGVVFGVNYAFKRSARERYRRAQTPSTVSFPLFSKL